MSNKFITYILNKRLIFLVLGAIFSLILLLCFAAYLWINCISERLIVDKLTALTLPKNILVLGAKVEADGQPSKILRQRLDAAKAAYKYLQMEYGNEFKGKIIVSGGTFTNYDEPEAMKAYLERQGVDAAVIEMDKQGVNTYHSFRNYVSLHATEALLVVTSAYHLPRACFLAQGLKIPTQGYGALDADHNVATQLYNFVREALSRVKAVLNLYFFPDW